MTAPDAIRPGTELGDEFVIENVLGQGGFGITYKIRALKTQNDEIVEGQPYVVKECFPNFLIARGEHGVTITARAPDSAEAQDQIAQFNRILDNFVDEARVLARFSHPNIVRVYLLREAYSTAYMIMEFIDGVTLHDYLGGRLLAMAELEPYARKLVDALQIVHDGGIIHRDIKPANIMVRKSGEPVLIDFGGAKPMQDADRSVIYTPGYAPPEQEQGLGATIRSDIFSLAVTLYRALTGEMPRTLAPDQRVVFHPLKDYSGRARQGISDAFADAIDWALELDPNERPGSVRQWSAALFPSAEARPAVVQPSLPSVEPGPVSAPWPESLDVSQPAASGFTGHGEPAASGRTTVIGLALGAGTVLLAVVMLILLLNGVFTPKPVKPPEPVARAQITATTDAWTSIDLSKAPAQGRIGFTADGRFRARIDGVLFTFVAGNALNVPKLTPKSVVQVKAEDAPTTVTVVY